jgi:GntR family transcriptional repressor for pyruvate dehydrogenase complex
MPDLPLAGPERLSLVDQLVRTIAEALLAGRYGPGDRLPPERDLAASLGVNRASLRQALARLEQMGLVEARHGVGTVVLDPARATDPSVLTLLAGRHGPRIVEDALEVRAVLAGLVGRLAAERASDEDRARLALALDELRRAEDAEACQEAEAVFFDALVDATGNLALRFLWNALQAAYGPARALFVAAYEDLAAVKGQLEAVVEALDARDAPGAERAVANYAAFNAALVREAFGPPGGGDA